MKYLLKLTSVALALGSLILTQSVLADEADEAILGDILIQESWARASLGKAPNSAAYMTLMSHGDAADKLIAVSTPVADRAELHNHILEDGIAKMRPVEAIELVPGEPFVLEPGGFHVMLMGLKEKLGEGESLPLTLTFEKAGEVTLDVPILGLKGPMKRGGDHKHDG